jgi:RNA polymerase sigma-B factor
MELAQPPQHVTDNPTQASLTLQTHRTGPSDGVAVDDDHAAVNRLIRRVQDHHDAQALQALVVQFDWVAAKCARRMYRRGESIEDLEQIAREALLGAVARFDTDRGVAFKTFAWSTAMGVLRHHYRDRWQLRVPRSLQELHLTAMHAIEGLSATHQRAPTIDELAERLAADRDDIILALEAGHAYRADSLDQPASERQPAGRHERASGTLDPTLEDTPDRLQVRALIATLPTRERTVLIMRFFEDRTQNEIGQSLGLSQVHVSRLLRSALNTLRERAGAA